MDDYLLTLHVEAKGTLYTNSETGAVHPSSAGHMWFEVVRPDGSSMLNSGFGPAVPKSTLFPVQGRTLDDDGPAYAGNPYFTATYRITGDQANTLVGYDRDPAAHGFDKNSYWAINNSCVDHRSWR